MAHYDTSSSPQNIRAIWSLIHSLKDDLATAKDTITQQQTTIASLTVKLTATDTKAQQALIFAGKAASLTSQGVSPAPGGGGGSGGGGGDTHPNHYDLVVEAKADLTTEGEDLTGPCGAFKIVRRAAQYIAPSDPTVGLLDKPTGNNCTGYATDIIAYRDGIIYDVLIDAGGANTPAWSFSGSVDPSRYRPPF